MFTGFHGGMHMKHRQMRRFWEQRMRRGDVKYLLLETLLKRPMHGYDVIQDLEERHQGRYRPSPGSVYPTLQMLEDGGFVTSQVIDGKRVYEITDAGRRLLEERGDVGAKGDAATETGDWHEMGDSARKFVEAMRQGFHQSDPKTREKIRKVVDGARREIYTILAGGD
jgi:DNA-binding PadR family transcriptional regulator